MTMKRATYIRKIAGIQERFDKAASMKRARQAVLSYLKLFAQYWGYSEDSFFITDEGWNGGRAVAIRWEEGPYEWAACFTLGSNMHAGETGQYDSEGEFSTTTNQNGIFVEAETHFSITFWN